MDSEFTLLQAMPDAATKTAASSQKQPSFTEDSPLQLCIDACTNSDLSAFKELCSAKRTNKGWSNYDSPLQMRDIVTQFFAATLEAIKPDAELLDFLFSAVPNFELSYPLPDIAFGPRDPDIIRVVLAHNPSLANYEDDYATKLGGFCATAKNEGDVKIVKMLLEAGADPEEGPRGSHALDAAVGNEVLGEDVIKLLIEKGARVRESTIKRAEEKNRGRIVEILKGARQKQGGGGKCTVM